jgi:maltose 6'-phosphate phosphatase
MILNLHCYQEDNQDSKFTQIAKAINEQNIDVVCFQEVAEFWNDGHGDWDTNVAKSLMIDWIGLITSIQIGRI